jgi:hypothetical protein
MRATPKKKKQSGACNFRGLVGEKDTGKWRIGLYFAIISAGCTTKPVLDSTDFSSARKPIMGAKPPLKPMIQTQKLYTYELRPYSLFFPSSLAISSLLTFPIYP